MTFQDSGFIYNEETNELCVSALPDQTINQIRASIGLKPLSNDISATLAERGGRYGQFIDHSKISQGLQDVMREAPNWSKLDVDMRQALTTIVDKIARILNGDPYYDDSWHDISGYATLVERRIIELKQEKAA